jgi:hypothetical protein
MIKTQHRIKIGTSDFEKLVTESRIFVDKTLLIQDIIQDSNEVLLITRPRRWGKTLNMSMLGYFFTIPVKQDGSIDEEKRKQRVDLFSKMKLKKYPDTIKNYCGRYPTIFISFKGIKATSHEEMVEKTKYLVHELYRSHKYLLNSDKLDNIEKSVINRFLTKDFDIAEIEGSIKILGNMLYQHFGQKVVILIDEYDTPMNDWYAQALAKVHMDDNAEELLLKQILLLFSGILGAALKDNSFLEKAIITGILRIAKASLFSGINNLGEASLLDEQYAQHFGFTEEEVDQLLHDAGMDRNKIAIENLKLWYNGYNIGGITIYNPWSIMNYLNYQGELKAYWVGTASTALIENALVLDKFQEEIQQLIEGKTVPAVADPKMVFSDIKSSPNALYNLLLFSGYLTAETIKQGRASTYNCDLRIPNREVLEVFEVSIMQWVSNKFNIEPNEYNAFINELLAGKIDVFIDKLRNYLTIASSYYSTGPKNAEIFYNGFMLGLISSVSLEYIVESEKESGSGRIDLLLLPKANAKYRNAVILEFKLANNKENLKLAAKKALHQIKSRKYEAKILACDNIERTLKLGLAFCGKEVEVAWE